MASAEDAVEESLVTAARRSRLFRIFVEIAKLDTPVLAGDIERRAGPLASPYQYIS